MVSDSTALVKAAEDTMSLAVAGSRHGCERKSVILRHWL